MLSLHNPNTYDPSAGWDPAFSAHINGAMDKKAWIDIVAEPIEIFNLLVGLHFKVKVYHSPGGPEDTLWLLVTAVEERSYSGPRRFKITQILEPTSSLLDNSAGWSGLTSRRIGEWLMGEDPGLRRRGWIHKEFRKALEAKLNLLEEDTLR